MGQFSFDIADLASRLDASRPKNKIVSTETNKVPYQDNKNKFKKLAFDMFQSKYDQTIWELTDENNSKYLVKRTDLDDKPLEVEAMSSNTTNVKLAGAWSAADVEGNPVVLYLFATPVRAFDKKAFGYDRDTTPAFIDHVLDTVKSNKNVAHKYVTGMSKENKALLIKKCQENINDEEARLAFSWLANETL